MTKKTNRVKHRVLWGFSPVSRVVPSKKRYSRIMSRRATRRETAQHHG